MGKNLGDHKTKKRIYKSLIEKQGNTCAICGTAPGFHNGNKNIYTLAIDHDHKTGEPRGLLCNKCNSGIGFLKDDFYRCYLASEYLLKFEREIHGKE